MKDYMTELEMEQYLINNGYDIYDEEGNTDTTQVVETAISLGYESILEDAKEFLEFKRL